MQTQKSITQDVSERLKDYPLYSQEKANENPMILAKLFNSMGSGTWWLSEYNPETHIAFGYVTGMDYDEWGYVSLDEMEEVRILGRCPIEVDLQFTPCQFKELNLL
jgi:hypothetical protein